MIRTLLIEDEEPAAQRLEKLLIELEPDIKVINCLDSIDSAIKWFKNNEQPDLVMLDIQLADGLSFDIFKEIKIDCFIIFTTAYDEYAIKAFELNSIDYLLKPIDKAKLDKSLKKFKNLKSAVRPKINLEGILAAIENKETNYKKRFAVNYGNKIRSVESHQIAYFSSIEKSTFLVRFEGQNYPIDFSLDRLELVLDPEKFFRINRQTIINYSAIEKINVLSKSRIEVSIKKSDERFLVSTAKAHNFRQWLDK